MEARQLGRSGLRISTISFGTATFGGGYPELGATDLDQARALVATCIEAGVNLFDTADVYSDGRAEELLGRALRSRRDQVLVATKAHFPTGSGPNAGGSTRHHLIRACEASLRRLGTDWIDLFQLHSIDELTDVHEVVATLDDLVRSGKVRYVGCSNYSGWHLMRALAAADARGRQRFASMQGHYSLLARELEWELMPCCLDQGVGILVWSPLAGGLLTGKFGRGVVTPEGARTGHLEAAVFADRDPGTPQMMGTLDRERVYDIVDVIVDIAGERRVTPAQVALNWVLARSAVTSAVVGARNLDQLRDSLAASTWSLADDEVERLDEVSSRPLPFPYWHHHDGKEGNRIRTSRRSRMA